MRLHSSCAYVLLLTLALQGEPLAAAGDERQDGNLLCQPTTPCRGLGGVDASEQLERAEEETPRYRAKVTARRAALTAGAATLEAEQIRLALPGSGSEALGLVPGLRIVQHGAEGKGHQIFLRGFDAVHGSDVEVRLAGMPLNERVQVHGRGYVDLYGIVPEAIRQMRVEKGPFLPWQGDYATAGSVDFELGLAEEDRPGLVRLEASEHGRLRAAAVVAPRGAPDVALFAAEAVHDEGFGPDREADRGGLTASWGFDLGGRVELSALSTLQTARWESPGVFRFDTLQQGRDFYDAYGPPGRGESDRWLTRLALRRNRAGQALELALAGTVRRLLLEDNYTGWLLFPERGDRKRQEQAGWTIGSIATARQRVGRWFPATLLGGLGWRLDRAELREDQVDGQGIPWKTEREQLAWAHELFAYGGVRLRPWERIELLPSLRGELLVLGAEDHRSGDTASRSFGVLCPRLTLSFRLAAPLTLFVAGGRGFRSPEVRSVLAPPSGSVEDENLARYQGGKPEITVAESLEAGLDWHAFEGLSLRLAAFSTRSEHEVIFDHVSSTTVELDGTRRRGAELALRLRPVSWGEAVADVSRTDARFARSGHPVPGSAAWVGRGSLQLGQARGLHGAATLTWASTRQLAHGATASGMARTDLTLGWRFASVDLVIAVDNATDERIMDGAYHYASWFEPASPRSAIPVIHYTAAPPRTAHLVLTGSL